MKKTIGISLFIFFAIVVAVLVAGLIFYQNNKSANSLQTINNANNNLQNNTATSTGISIKLTLSEISKHNNISDCYMVINNKVYNITSYFGAHPGGDRSMVPYCGKDSNQAYDTKGGRGNAHSSYAASLLDQYYIGDLNQTISQTTLQQNIQKTTSVPSPAKNGWGGESEDD